VFHDGKLKHLGVHATESEAWDMIVVWHETRAKRGGSDSFLNFGESVLESRELEGTSDAQTDAGRFRKHIATAPWASQPVDKIETPELVDWLRKSLYRRKADDQRGSRLIKRRTVQRIMSLVSVIFSEAVLHGKRSTNPCAAIEVKLTSEEIADQEEAWDWIRPAEQKKFLAATEVPEAFRVMSWFAWRTGLRQGEQWSLTLDRVIMEAERPHLVVNKGSAKGSTKTRRTRRVPLFGEGLDAAKAWLEILPHYAKENPRGLVFPRACGTHRGKGPPKLGITVDGKPQKVLALDHYMKLAGVDRYLRWHDLRHSFAANLVSGLWGRPRSLLEIKALMGHGSIKTTEIYAHLADGFVDVAASEEGWKEDEM
jgi:integrase